MSRPVALRLAIDADAHGLAAIRRDAILTLAAAKYGSDRARRWAESSGDERVQRAIEQNEVWVAEDRNVAVAWVEIDRDRIEGIYVHPDVAGTGVGSALLLHAEDLIRSAGHAAVALDASWNAERFYLRRGYRAQAETRGDSGLPMVKPLRSAAPLARGS